MPPHSRPFPPPNALNPGFNHPQPLRPLPPHLQRPQFDHPIPSSSPKILDPLDDLVDTEKEYISDLKILLQRISAGWTQQDYPPKEVDEMLRNIEEVHETSRQLSRRLGEIIEGKDALHELEIAAEQFQHVTLDSFMMKPIDRLHYYRRLYIRMLDSTDRGNPVFNALESAFFRVDAILRLVTIDVPGTSRHPASPALSGISNMSALKHALPSPPISGQISPNFSPQHKNPMSPALPPSPLSPGMSPNHHPQHSPNHHPQHSPNYPPQQSPNHHPQHSPNYPPQHSPNYPPQRSPNHPPQHSPNHPPQQSPSHHLQQSPVFPSPTSESMLELEKTLDTTKVLDLFTMQPKDCTLSLALLERQVTLRGNFTYTIAADDGTEDRFEDGHVILLSDLLLLCRTKTQQEISNNPEGVTSTLWLLFPPLAVRHVTARDLTQGDGVPVVEVTIVNRVKSRIWILNDQLKFAWINEVNNAQQKDSAKALQQQQQQQQQGPQLNRTFTQNRPMRPMAPGSPLSPVMNSVPMSPHLGAASPIMGGRPPMGSPGFRPQMLPGGQGPRPGPRPGPMHHGGGSFSGRPSPRPFGRAMSMRRMNTTGGRPGAPRGRILTQGDVAAAKEVILKTKPCDVFQWRENNWEPLVEDDDVYVELRLTIANRLAMAVTTCEYGQLVLNAWIVGSTTFRRASETDVSVSMDMGASVQWFLVALNNAREADEFCHTFQRTKDRAMYDPSLQKSASPILSRGDSLASTVTPKVTRPVKQTQSSMYPPSECKLFIQGGDLGHWISLGSARVEIKMEKPSGHVRLFVSLLSGNKPVLNSVIVQCDCLELLGPRKLAITLMNTQEKMSIIYLLQFKDEVITGKIFEGLSLNENE
ncbi:hypothetical protein BGZ76_001568 [Entomortierella beljakovae]|nr:hypothetical protein BGZ76_001568 [Entomortierella beljakovae]